MHSLCTPVTIQKAIQLLLAVAPVSPLIVKEDVFIDVYLCENNEWDLFMQ